MTTFLYAEVGEGRGPAFFRRGGLVELQRRLDAGELEPASARRPGPGAGAALVGARRPLIAFNVNLRDAGVEVAREIAAVVRGGRRLPGVRALGLELPAAGRAQVSMNVEDWEAAALHDIVRRVEEEAHVRGAEVVGSELVGLMPAGAAAAAAGSALRIEGSTRRASWSCACSRTRTREAQVPRHRRCVRHAAAGLPVSRVRRGARAGAPYARTGPSLFLHGQDVLIDTPEESREQLNRAGIGSVRACLYSHWHPDHVMGRRVFESMNFPARVWPRPPAPATDVYPGAGRARLRLVARRPRAPALPRGAAGRGAGPRGAGR